MTPEPLTWSDPRPTGRETVEAVDGLDHWRISPVPGDVARIHFATRDDDGTIVCSIEAVAWAESAEEARIVVDVLRAGTDHLPGWREQLEAAGFRRSHPDHPEDEALGRLWDDRRASGLFQVRALDPSARRPGGPATSVTATYESSRSTSWHNVAYVDGSPARAGSERNGLPKGVDPLKAGVAAAIAIRDARAARGGRFATPLGGPTRKR